MARSDKNFDDALYQPPSETASTAGGSTPPTRAMYRTAPKEARARVDKATAKLTKTRCLITNIECDKMVDYSHVMRCAVENNEDEVSVSMNSRAQAILTNRKLNKLEYSWDIGWYSLHIHTRRNIFRRTAYSSYSCTILSIF
jgi:hypothetical protein